MRNMVKGFASGLGLFAIWLLCSGQTYINGDQVSKYFYTNNGIATANLRTCNAALEGTFAYDTTTNALTVCNGSAWGGAGISGLTIGTTTITSGGAGRLLYDDATPGTLQASASLTWTEATADFIVTKALSGGGLNIRANNTSNTASSTAWIQTLTGGASAGDPYFISLVTGGGGYAWGVDNSTTGDLFVLSRNNGSGGAPVLGTTNVLVADNTTIQAGMAGSVTVPAWSWEGDPDTGLYNTATNLILLTCGGATCGQFQSTGYSIDKALAGSTIELDLDNTDNTNAASHSLLQMFTGGASAGDPKIGFRVATTALFTMGIDNSDSDNFKISQGTSNTLGSGDTVTIPVVASIANGFTLTGSAATSPVAISASGSDTNISLNLTPKGTGDVAVTSGALVLPAATVVGVQRSGDTDTGIGASSADSLYLYAGGEKAFLDAGRLTLESAVALSWRATQPSAGAPTLFLYHDAAAVLQQGADSATPIAQTFKGPDGSGTDIAGGALTIAGGKGTGNAVGGDVAVQTSIPGSTGAVVETLGDRSRVLGKYTTLTETTATAFARVAVASGTVVGGEVVVTVEANDATDFQARTLRFGYSAVNKAGTTTTGIDTPSESVAVSLGTLTCTITAVDATNNVDFKANCTSSLTQTTLRANAIVTAKNFGTGAISAQ